MMGLRIVLVTVDEPFYLPKFFGRLIEARQGDVVGVVLVPSVPPGKSWARTALTLYRMYGLQAFTRMLLAFGARKALAWTGSIFPWWGPFSVRGAARKAGLPVLRVPSINHPRCLEILLQWRPDVIVAQVPNVVRREVLAIPPKGVLNKHASLLPRYRGVFPIFWALRYGEREVGVTIHWMNERIDEGIILGQRPIAVDNGDSIHSLYERVFAEGAELLLAVLDQMERGELEGRPQSVGEGSYFSYPGPEDIRAFRGRGRRFW